MKLRKKATSLICEYEQELKDSFDEEVEMKVASVLLQRAQEEKNKSPVSCAKDGEKMEDDKEEKKDGDKEGEGDKDGEKMEAEDKSSLKKDLTHLKRMMIHCLCWPRLFSSVASLQRVH